LRQARDPIQGQALETYPLSPKTSAISYRPGG
jgi:hypothetical protein